MELETRAVEQGARVLEGPGCPLPVTARASHLHGAWKTWETSSGPRHRANYLMEGLQMFFKNIDFVLKQHRFLGILMELETRR
jgi:hypothetical protein